MQLPLGTPERVTPATVPAVAPTKKRMAYWTTLLVCLLVSMPLPAQTTLLVDGSGIKLPTAFTTIQQAVYSAIPGDQILVFPGVYSGTVSILGHAKDGLKIIAVGNPDEVVLQGDHKFKDGFHLEDVDRVLIQGFTVRDFGTSPSIGTAWGVGNNIYLLRANFNTIRQNRVALSDKFEIALVDSADNLIEDNVIWSDPSLPVP
jgi:hypothetical protein